MFVDHDLSAYDDGGTSMAAEDWMRDLLVQALVDAGCPEDAARALVEHASVRTGKGVRWSLHVHEAGYWATRVRIRRDEFAEAAMAIAEILRDASAEAVDRSSRGENWPPPYWDLPDRRPRGWVPLSGPLIRKSPVPLVRRPGGA